MEGELGALKAEWSRINVIIDDFVNAPFGPGQTGLDKAKQQEQLEASLGKREVFAAKDKKEKAVKFCKGLISLTDRSIARVNGALPAVPASFLMPVSFLTPAQRERYGRYPQELADEDLARYFYLDDETCELILMRRGDHNRFGFALQLTTVRYLGTFLEHPVDDVPHRVRATIAAQLKIGDAVCLQDYQGSRQRHRHASEIRERYGYRDFSEPPIGFWLARWLCALCWTGTDRPGVLFERATAWLLTHKVLLPGVTTLDRFIAQVRARMEARLWRLLSRGVTDEQRARLEALLTVAEGSRQSWLDKLRKGPVRGEWPRARASAATAGNRTRTRHHLAGRCPHSA